MPAQIFTGLRTCLYSAAADLPLRRVRRRISPQAGRALEILGHAIEYLSDEFMHDGGSASDGRVEAIQLLMSVNRQIYFECPEILPLRSRLRILGFLCRQES